jgi:hypothetical protein
MHIDNGVDCGVLKWKPATGQAWTRRSVGKLKRYLHFRAGLGRVLQDSFIYAF